MTNDFSLKSYVRDQFDGMLVVGDIHADLESITSAVEYSRRENYFLMLLGDLVDRGDHPFEVVDLVYKGMQDGRIGFTVGNHDDKFRRYALGNKVRLGRDATRTVETVGELRMEEFLSKYTSIINDVILSSIFHTFDNIVLAHAASHADMFTGASSLSKAARARALVGETNGEVYDDGYPVRLYNWIDEIPMGKTVIVGHDKMPIDNINITEPKIVINSNGGKAIFIDTGCGKGGFLTGALILNTKSGFKIDSFMEFK